MAENINYRIMAIATTAMALSAAIQAIVGFQQFRINMSLDLPNILALASLGIMVLITMALAWNAYLLSRR